MGALALLSTLSDLFQSGAKAKDQLRQEQLDKSQVYSQLETAALERERLRQQMRLAEHPPSVLKQQLADMEAAMGRPLTDIEKERALGVAPKDLTPRVATKLVQDKNSSTGWSFISYDPLSGTEYSRQLDAPPQRGLIESETSTTDPLTGLTTVSKRKPILPGAKTPPGKAPVTPSSAAAAAPSGVASALYPPAPLPVLAGRGRRKATPSAPSAGPLAKAPASAAGVAPAPLGLPQLDANGHIPQLRGVPPAVVETANELLDDKDMDKIKYAKLIPVAAALARRYGWEQGKFTPKEQTMLRETSNFIRKAMDDGSMAALDEGTLSRIRISQLIQNPDRQGFLGRTAQGLMAKTMSPSQVAFVQTYNQLVGVISGLSQLVRSGRATESTIERLKSELPNPNTTKNSADAQQRLRRLMEEITLAMQKGRFTESEASGGGSTPSSNIPSGGGKVIVVRPEDMR